MKNLGRQKEELIVFSQKPRVLRLDSKSHDADPTKILAVEVPIFLFPIC